MLYSFLLSLAKAGNMLYKQFGSGKYFDEKRKKQVETSNGHLKSNVA
ncbi:MULTISPECIES: hypothetical protein [Lactococcus]|nr:MULTISPECIES: hypothetical protein [Lactococcus]MCI1072206.1 hypothetical protein [Lactococcus lactis]WGV29994.1 hypothetical protein QJV49_10875 [Lactococcus sp. NH2-7C]